MAKIAVFDSGLGSLSIIKPIQKAIKSDVVYFADQKNFPYGKKSKKELQKIIYHTIQNLKEIFHPDFIVVGSNTPTLMLDIEDKKIIGVRPPLKEAVKISNTNNIGVLATSSAVKSRGLSNYIKSCNIPKKYTIKKIDASNLIELVESGKFLTDKSFCKRIIKNHLQEIIQKSKMDVCTLSSTHLPFLKNLLEDVFPNVVFVDPGKTIAKKIAKKIQPSKKNSLKIFSSGDIKKFQRNLKSLEVKNKVTFLSF